MEEIAGLEPDLILATSSGITEAEYKKLSKIADVVAYPGDPWVTAGRTPWRWSAPPWAAPPWPRRSSRATEASIAAAAEAHPDIVGKSFIFASLSTADMSKVDYYTPVDNRPRLLADLGMVNAPVIEKISEEGAFYGTLSAERAADLESDVFITYAETEKDLADLHQGPAAGPDPRHQVRQRPRLHRPDRRARPVRPVATGHPLRRWRSSCR